MRPTLIVTHLDDRDTGLVRGCLERAGCPVAQVDSVDGDPLPPLSALGAIVTLGGRQSATRADQDPFLSAEVGLLSDALVAGVPVLGMCLGAQLLAVAGGGRVAAMESMYAGWPPLALLPCAASDPVFGALPDGLPVLKWHEDLIQAPAGAQLLGTTASPGAALFRVGASAWGSQMHLELTPGLLVDTWLAESGGIAEIEGAGHPIAEFRAESRRRLVAQMAAARPMFARFAEVVRSRSA
ncbi:MAG: type 1 glutamine amidotransferase [Solirubrobacteraceae bacterium]